MVKEVWVPLLETNLVSSPFCTLFKVTYPSGELLVWQEMVTVSPSFSFVWGLTLMVVCLGGSVKPKQYCKGWLVTSDKIQMHPHQEPSYICFRNKIYLLEIKPPTSHKQPFSLTMHCQCGRCCLLCWYNPHLQWYLAGKCLILVTVLRFEGDSQAKVLQLVWEIPTHWVQLKLSIQPLHMKTVNWEDSTNCTGQVGHFTFQKRSRTFNDRFWGKGWCRKKRNIIKVFGLKHGLPKSLCF